MFTERKAFKVLVLGDPSVGKTELCLHAIYQDDAQRPEASPTVGMNMHLISNNNVNRPIVLTVWDCAGFQIHQEAIAHRIAEASGFILVYDVGNPQSFANLQNWIHLIKTCAKQNWVGELIANKKDGNDRRDISIENGVTFAKKFGFSFREISTKDKTVVKQFFSGLFDKFSLQEQPKEIKFVSQPSKTEVKKGDGKDPKEKQEKKKSDCQIF